MFMKSFEKLLKQKVYEKFLATFKARDLRKVLETFTVRKSKQARDF